MFLSALQLIAQQAPGDAWAALNAIVFFLVPGIAMAVAVARRLGWGLPAVVAAAFTISSALASIVMLVGTWLGLSLSVGIAAWVLLAAGTSAWAFFLGRGQAPLDVDRPGLVLALVAGAAALLQGSWFRPSADTFYHLAAARSLLVRDALTVTDPFHGTATSVADPTSGVLHTMLAMVSRLRGLDMTVVWTGLNVLGAVVLICAFYALVKRLVGPGWATTAATFGYLVFNQFADFRAASYPNRISIAIVFFGLLCLTELFDRPTWTAAVAAVATGVAVSAMHVGNAELYVLMAMALAFWALVDGVVAKRRDGRFEWDGVLWLSGVLLVTGLLAAPFILPKLGVVSGSAMVDTAAAVSRIDLFQIGPFVVTRPGRFFDGGNLPFVMTTALALFMAGWSFVRRDRTALAALAFCSLPVLLLFDPPVTTLAVRFSFYNLARIAALLGFTTYIAAAWALARPKGAGGRSQAVFLGAVTLAATLVISVPYLQTTWTERIGAVRKGMNVSVWKSRVTDVRNQWGFKVVERITEKLDATYPMVAADPETGYYLSGLASVRLVAVPRSHSPLAIETVSGAQRREAMRELLFPTTTQARRRVDLETWNADYVLLWTSRLHEGLAAESMSGQPGLFTVYDSSSKLLLLKVER
jgi:hypothetical protein